MPGLHLQTWALSMSSGPVSFLICQSPCFQGSWYTRQGCVGEALSKGLSHGKRPWRLKACILFYDCPTEPRILHVKLPVISSHWLEVGDCTHIPHR